ncbi:MAG: hypothetical protein R2817_08740 [Flavobacteriales bacterium]
MRHFNTLLLLALSLAPLLGRAQAQGPNERFYSFLVEHPISILEEKHLTQLAVDMDPHARLLVDDGRRDLVVRTRSALKVDAFVRAAGELGMPLRRTLHEAEEHQPTSPGGN